MSAQDQPYINRAIRTIRTELNFLHDTGALRPSELDQILSLMPQESSTSSPAQTRAPSVLPAPAQSATPAQPAVHSHYSPPLSPPASTNTPLSQKLPIPGPAAPPPTYTPTALVVARAEALWAFPGSEPGDLAFQPGDTIEVVEKVKEDWWRGRIAGGNGDIGLFPSSYVRETQQMAESKLPSLPPRGPSYGSGKSGYGPGGNMMTDMAHGSPAPSQSVGDMQMQQQPYGGPEQPKEKSKVAKNGEKFGKKLGNAAIFGAGATIGGKIVNGIF